MNDIYAVLRLLSVLLLAIPLAWTVRTVFLWLAVLHSNAPSNGGDYRA